MNNPLASGNILTPEGKEDKNQQPVEERIALAAGYAVLVRRNGGTVEEVVSELRDVYQLTEGAGNRSLGPVAEKIPKGK
ncbi:MAG TPA: hypothetical protein VLC98_08745 [Phnomibacter sp.]|nr:hypothetical protein [Phnomibacter sp.]